MPSCPKIELHLHLEGTIRPATLLAIVRRNGASLPVRTEAEVRQLYNFGDFRQFVDVWVLTTNVLHREEDFHQVVVEYAAEAVAHGCVYLEAIFSPAEQVRRGVRWEAIFTGYCDGAQEARERYGLEVNLSADIVRGASLDEAVETVRRCARYRERGVVGVGLAGIETAAPARELSLAFELARDLGLAVLPHAGETSGPATMWEALEVLRPTRIRHGIAALGDPALVATLVDEGIVLDVCPASNLRTGIVPDVRQHPLPALVEAGVLCSVSTDDPAMFITNLDQEYGIVTSLGVSLRSVFEAGLTGAQCDERTRSRLRQVADAYPWPNEANHVAGDAGGPSRPDSPDPL